MNSIAKFFTIYWIIYFPTCIAFNELPGFSFADEVMTAILIGYTFMMKGHRDTNPKPWKEFYYFLLILTFYIVYSLIRQVNVPKAVWMEFVQQIRPYSIIYCTWILNPRFTKAQKKWIMTAMIVTLGTWIYYHPVVTTAGVEAEFPVLGQLAICTGMAFYLFSEEKKQNTYLALALVLTGMLAPKFKYLGEVVCFVAIIFYLKEQLDFKSPKTVLYGIMLMSAVLFVTWERFDAYYVSGINENKARPATYRTSLKILVDYIPFGPGMGTFATNAAWRIYSPLYPKYGLNKIWGLNEGGGFICDAFYPTLAQYGIVGVILFGIFWKRRLVALNQIEDIRWYRIAFITFFCLAIEQTADSSWLSGKGMGYCMLIGLCLNANLNKQRDEEEERFLLEEEERLKRRRIEGMEEMRKDGNDNENDNDNENLNHNLNPNGNVNDNGNDNLNTNLNTNLNLNLNDNENENENENENLNENENVEGDVRHV